MEILPVGVTLQSTQGCEMHHGLKLTLTLVLAGAVLAGNGWASATARAVGSYDGAKVRVIQETFSGIRIGFDLSQATLTPVATVAESATEPELVSATRWVVVPDRGVVSLKACRNGTAYLGKPQIFRGVRIAPVTVSSSLGSPDEVELELEFTAGIGVNELGALSRVPITPQFANLLESVALNPPRDRFPGRDLAAESLSRMLLLYPEAINDQATLDLIEEFADWKRRLGLRVDVEAIDTDAMDAEAIKGVISDYYHEDPPIDYVAIIGDDRFPKTYWLQAPPPSDQELFFPGYPKTLPNDILGKPDTTHLVDMLYTTMDGDQDMAPDIGIGRFWVRTLEQLKGALRRSIRADAPAWGSRHRHGTVHRRSAWARTRRGSRRTSSSPSSRSA